MHSDKTDLLSISEAEQHLQGVLRKFFEDVIERGKSTKLALRISPGVGKTTETLKMIAQRGEELLANGHVLIYMPTLALCNEAAAQFAKLAPHLPTLVFRGRSAINPATKEPMCERDELVAKIAKVVPCVTIAICKRDLGERGTQAAPCASGCPYLSQDPDVQSVVFLSHQYVKLSPPVSGDISLQVIDERIWQTLIEKHEISLDQWMRKPPSRLSPTKRFSDAILELHAKVRTAVAMALIEGKPVIATLKALDVSEDDLRALHWLEEKAAPKLNIRPIDDDTVAEAKLAFFKKETQREHNVRASVFEVLADAFSVADTCRLQLVHPSESTSARMIVHTVSKVSEDTPILLLDADANPAVTDSILPGSAFRAITVASQAEVVQVTDRTLSNSWLLDETAGKTRRAGIRAIVEREVQQANGKGVLVVATKKVIVALKQDTGGLDCAANGSVIPGAVVANFGPAMLGVNRFKSFATCVIVGRLQPPLDVVEDAMRALFGDHTDLEFAPDGQLVTRRTPNGQTMHVHPDPRGQAILEQMREMLTQQALARLRLTRPDGPKRIVILSSVPLPEIQPTKQVTFFQLRNGWEDEPFPTKRRRLELALQHPASMTSEIIRLSPAGLHEDLPWEFGTLNAAKEFRRSLPTEELVAMFERIASDNGWVLSVSETIKRRTGGRRGLQVTIERQAEFSTAA